MIYCNMIKTLHNMLWNSTFAGYLILTYFLIRKKLNYSRLGFKETILLKIRSQQSILLNNHP